MVLVNSTISVELLFTASLVFRQLYRIPPFPVTTGHPSGKRPRFSFLEVRERSNLEVVGRFFESPLQSHSSSLVARLCQFPSCRSRFASSPCPFDGYGCQGIMRLVDGLNVLALRNLKSSKPMFTFVLMYLACNP